MEVSCLVHSTKFNDLIHSLRSYSLKRATLFQDINDFLLLNSQTKRRKPHEARSIDWQEEVSKPRAHWVMQFTYCAGWGFGSSLILKHKKIKKCAQLSAYQTERDEENNKRWGKKINNEDVIKDGCDINNYPALTRTIFKKYITDDDFMKTTI